ALVIERPHVEAARGEHVHHRVLALAGNREIEARLRRDRRAVHEYQDGQGLLTGLRRGGALAIERERDVALLRLVLGGPELAVRARCRLRARRVREEGRAKTGADD